MGINELVVFGILNFTNAEVAEVEVVVSWSKSVAGSSGSSD